MIAKSFFNSRIALLILGSAIFAYSCKGDSLSSQEIDPLTTPTMETDSLTLKYSEDGDLSYRFTTPKLRRFERGDSIAFMEFPEGLLIETFNDSTGILESSLVAEYGYFDEKLELWRVERNVVGSFEDGKQLETEQLFWNQNKKIIYSNVRSVITDNKERMVGRRGFEADENLENVVFNSTVGTIEIDTTTTSQPASIGTTATPKPTRSDVEVNESSASIELNKSH